MTNETSETNSEVAETALEVRVTGRVQGVWFRAWTQKEAESRGIRGWVRNCDDGSVRALIAGPENAVRDLVGALHRGSPAARVSAVETSPAQPPAVPGFSIRR